jgi:hypothetical protein
LGLFPVSNSTQEEEIEQPKIDARSRTARAQSAREPKKTLKINGNGLSRSVGSATPSATAQSEDISPSSKKKRKTRKKYLVSWSSQTLLLQLLTRLVSRTRRIR